MSTNIEPEGPFLFELPELQPGESWNGDFRNREKNGRKGGYKPFVPFDYLQVTNQNVDNNVRVSINGGTYEDIVVANSIESYDEIDVADVRIFNAGSTAISADDVVIAVGNEPYGADDAARERKQTGPVSQVVEHLTGLNINGV